MNFEWSKDQTDFYLQALHFSKNELSHHSDCFETKSFRDKWIKCAQFGIQGLSIVKEYGGMDRDFLTCAIVMEALGTNCRDNGFLFSLGAQSWSCASPVARFGSSEQKAKYLPGLCKGELIGANAMTEPDSGSDVSSITTKATRVEGGFILNGRKSFVTNGPLADVFVVYAVLDKNRSAFLVERKSIGVRCGKNIEKMGMRSSPTCELVLEDCFVPESSLLGEEGSASIVFNMSMIEERILIMASHLGAMTSQLESTRKFAKTRRQFGKSILEFQSVSQMIVEMKMLLETSRLLVYRAAWLKSIGKTAAIEASMAKLYVSEAWVKCNLLSMRVHGGQGYTVEFGVEQQLRDSLGSLFYSGTSEIQGNIISELMD